jgi:hypothetical protein
MTIELQRWRSGVPLIAGLFGALLLWVMARAVINHVPLYDELLHFLSAEGIRRTGEPAIASGLYTRALLYTKLVAASLAIFGDNIVAARLPALAAAMVLIFVGAAWIAHRVGLIAGLVSATCLCLVPATLELAVFARFYTLHALLILSMGIVLFEALIPGRSRLYRTVLIILAAVLIPPAWHLQPTTLVAVAALLCGATALLLVDHWLLVRTVVLRYPVRIAAAGAAVVLAGAILTIRLDLIAPLREVPLWAAWAANTPEYYLIDFSRGMPLLWPLFPAVAITALLVHRRLTIFCTVVLLVALLVHSMAAAKSTRYVYYALPFFCMVWGCAIDSAITLVGGSLQPGRRNARIVAACAVVALATVVLALSTEGQRLSKLALGREASAAAWPYATEPDWSSAVGTLEPIAAGADRVITSNAMKALYYLGRYDYELNVSIVAETNTRADFGLDERTGGRAIGRPESVRQIIEMPGTTLVVLEARKIGYPSGVPSAAVAAISASCPPVTLPEAIGVRAWLCAVVYK